MQKRCLLLVIRIKSVGVKDRKRMWVFIEEYNGERGLPFAPTQGSKENL